jgi:hypothetical protein
VLYQERERLLHVIESGFGSLDSFNMLVSTLFEQQATRESLKRGKSITQTMFAGGSVLHNSAVNGLRRTTLTLRMSGGRNSITNGPQVTTSGIRGPQTDTRRPSATTKGASPEGTTPQDSFTFGSRGGTHRDRAQHERSWTSSQHSQSLGSGLRPPFTPQVSALDLTRALDSSQVDSAQVV